MPAARGGGWQRVEAGGRGVRAEASSASCWTPRMPRSLVVIGRCRRRPQVRTARAFKGHHGLECSGAAKRTSIGAVI